ncbi:PAS domain S-box protein [Sporomusa rhizae]|uniref:PAS domain S-box protein n=1 Tax=Sporomusa rhizae TaxID=357999 RepID=UPI00352B3B2D
MLPSSIHARVYILITIIVTIPLIFFAYINANNTKQRLILEKQQTLTMIANTLDQKAIRSYDSVLEERNAQNLSVDEKRRILNEFFQPFINEVFQKYPGYGLAYYHRDYNVIALAPYKENLIGVQAHPLALQVYETQAITFVQLDSGVMRGGKPLLAVIYPLLYEGKVIGHAAVNITIEDIENEFYAVLARNILVTFGIWCLIIITIRWCFNGIDRSLKEFAVQAKEACTDISKFKSFPPLIPVFAEIIDLRENLRKREHSYRTLAENSPDSIYRFDRDGRLLYFNPEAERRVGRKFPLGRKPGEYSFIPPMYSQFVVETVKRVVETGTKVEVEYENKDFQKWRNRHFKLTYIPEKNSRGEVETVLGFSRDVTEIKQANERFLKAFNLNPNLMMLVSLKDRTYIDVNEAFLKACSLKREEVVGRSVLELNLFADAKQQEELQNLLFGQGYISNYELQYRCGDTVRTGLLACETIEVFGIASMLHVITDITAKKQLDSELARFESLNLIGEMAASIAHEVRNPMTAVRGYLQFFQRSPKFVDYDEQLEIMINEIDRANSIITEFLSLAKNKRSELEIGNLNDIINVMQPLLQADAMCFGHSLRLETSPIPDILLDNKEIRQLILNLVRNAYEAMELPGSVIIKTYSNNDNIVLEIKDTGKGIPSEIRHKLGTPFVTTKDQGTGLGLAVCYRVAERHTAVIEFDSSLEGTTFFVKFRTE